MPHLRCALLCWLLVLSHWIDYAQRLRLLLEGHNTLGAGCRFLFVAFRAQLDPSWMAVADVY